MTINMETVSAIRKQATLQNVEQDDPFTGSEQSKVFELKKNNQWMMYNV